MRQQTEVKTCLWAIWMEMPRCLIAWESPLNNRAVQYSSANQWDKS